jgi:hypothetical protein
VRNIILDVHTAGTNEGLRIAEEMVKTLICSYWRLLRKMLNVIRCLGPFFLKFCTPTLDILSSLQALPAALCFDLGKKTSIFIAIIGHVLVNIIETLEQSTQYKLLPWWRPTNVA